MTQDKLITLTKEAIRQGRIAGFNGMSQAPISKEKIEKDGTKLASDQELRSLAIFSDNKTFLIFFLNDDSKFMYSAVWEVDQSKSQILPNYKWQGWTKL